MTLREQIVGLLLAELPDGVKNHLDSTWSLENTNPSYPTDKDEAVLEQGRLAYALNKALTAFNGFTPIAAMLRIGQLNATLISILLASIEKANQFDVLDVEMVFPVENEAWVIGNEALTMVKVIGNLDKVAEVTYRLMDNAYHSLVGNCLQSESDPALWKDNLLVPPSFVSGTGRIDITVSWILTESESYQKTVTNQTLAFVD